MGAASSVGYLVGRKSAAQELHSYYGYQLFLGKADEAVQRTLVADDLRAISPDQIIAKQERHVAATLDAIGQLDMSAASYAQQADLQERMELIGRYYSKHQSAALSASAKRALEYRADAP